MRTVTLSTCCAGQPLQVTEQWPKARKYLMCDRCRQPCTTTVYAPLLPAPSQGEGTQEAAHNNQGPPGTSPAKGPTQEKTAS